MASDTPDPRATVELLTELESIYERTRGKTYSLPLQVTDEVRVFFKLDDIIRDLRRLVEYEAALHEIRVGKVQADNEHPQGEDFSMAMRFHKIAKDALAHREGQ